MSRPARLGGRSPIVERDEAGWSSPRRAARRRIGHRRDRDSERLGERRVEPPGDGRIRPRALRRRLVEGALWPRLQAHGSRRRRHRTVRDRLASRPTTRGRALLLAPDRPLRGRCGKGGDRDPAAALRDAAVARPQLHPGARLLDSGQGRLAALRRRRGRPLRPGWSVLATASVAPVRPGALLADLERAELARLLRTGSVPELVPAPAEDLE